ncbi:hypothetical protein [Pseudomonas sp. UBA1879]|uniref:hypothetical protein n=1 Tax=Pseudomonas sp. UBA1879 TaxID=1947305 RepID=UPI0025FA32F0|nr:hypothetical protein [Pseudomonas sp. UBA1879]
MGMIDIVSRNYFLKYLYPNGLIDDLLIGRLGFDCENKFCVNFHTKQQPAIEVKKWGIWGKNYDVIVICLQGQWVKDVAISNWEHIDFAPVTWSIDGDNKTFRSRGDGWEVSLTFGDLIFQGCRTYIW